MSKRSFVQASDELKPVYLEFEQADQFVRRTHSKDLEWIRTRRYLVETFEEFYEEYTYVVVASGFRGATAARLTPLLVECNGELERLLGVFKNRQKCQALADVYTKYHTKDEWQTLRGTFVDVDSLQRLPRIGPTVKWHLARNIGLCADVVKPDVHLQRLADKHQYQTPLQMCKEILEDYLDDEGSTTLGEIDFVLWVWLSHERGSKRQACCGVDGLRIR